MIAGTGLIGVAKDNLPRVGVTPGLTVTFAEIELDTETGKVDDHATCSASRIAAPCCIRRAWRTRSAAAT